MPAVPRAAAAAAAAIPSPVAAAAEPGRLLISPRARTLAKESAIDPAKTISLWPMQEAEDGALTAPDVISDGNPAAVEIARTYHDEVYAYPRNDALVDYSTLLGLGFALTRIQSVSAVLDGVQYSFEFAGFDQSGAAVVSASAPSKSSAWRTST